MSYNSKRILTNMAVGALLIIGYLIYALSASAPAPDDLRSWAVAMLTVTGIGVAAVIVVQILFHIAYTVGIAVKERGEGKEAIGRFIAASMVKDERGKLIDLRSSRIGYIVADAGFIVALVSLALGAAVVYALNIAFLALAVAPIVEGGVSVYLYERGVGNG